MTIMLEVINNPQTNIPMIRIKKMSLELMGPKMLRNRLVNF